MICWFLPTSIPSHLFSSLSMVCATFFSGTTFLPPPIFSESACLWSIFHIRTSRSVGYRIEGLFDSSWALCCCWLGTVLAFGKLFSLGLFVIIFLRHFYAISTILSDKRSKIPEGFSLSQFCAFYVYITHCDCFSADYHHFCLFAVQFQTFVKLSLSIMSKRARRYFSFSAIKTVSSAYRKLLTFFPPTLIPGCSSKFFS